MPTERLVGYCIRRSGDAQPEGLRGVEGAEVRALRERGLSLWVSGDVGGAATVERVREHDAVIRAAMTTATPLPLRYGSHFADEAAARELVRSRAAEFEESLGRVAGCVELGVRILWKAPPSPEAAAPRRGGSGREYLEARRAEMGREEAARQRDSALLERFDRHFPAIPAVRRPGSEPGVVGSVAHLVRGADLPSYRLLLQSAREELVETDLIVTGPWAPYSFV